jgi:SCY1-like protein 2
VFLIEVVNECCYILYGLSGFSLLSMLSIHVVCADIYRLMLSDKKYGLSVNLMATRVMPSLLPQTVNPSLNLEQFTNLLEVLQEMLDHIDRWVYTTTGETSERADIEGWQVMQMR